MIGKVISILTFPGVILHEYAHKLACEYYGVPVYDVRYFSFKLNRDGWVVHAPPRDFNSAFFISLAPFVVNNLAAVFCLGGGALVGTFIGAILIYIGFSSAMHSFPSFEDLNSTLKYKHELSLINKIFVYPILGLFYIAKALSYAWFDLFYAIGIMVIISHLNWMAILCLEASSIALGAYFMIDRN